MNSMVSYASSADLETWEDAAGNPLRLPITYETTPVAAAVPNEQGMVNGHQHVGFDTQGRPLVTYVRYDENGIAQAYLARFNGEAWEQHQISELDRVTHSPNRRGNPTPTSVEMRFGPRPGLDGTVSVDVMLLGEPVRIILDGESLIPIGRCRRDPSPGPLSRWAQRGEQDLLFKWQASGGRASDTDRVSMISWHAAPGNRDRANEDIPEPSTLRIHVLERPKQAVQ